ncbi:MAG TPA: hypothetical protein DEB24_00165, partial [Coriobacteriia bacterium]|nr:hypothetical protein [Coriobacteriia bacterium]
MDVALQNPNKAKHATTVVFYSMADTRQKLQNMALTERVEAQEKTWQLKKTTWVKSRVRYQDNSETSASTETWAAFVRDKEKLVSVAWPTIQRQPNGAEVTPEKLGLPKTLPLTIKGDKVAGTRTVPAEVQWSVSDYDPARQDAQTLTVKGTVTLPEPEYLDANGVELSRNLEVTVAAAKVSAV